MEARRILTLKCANAFSDQRPTVGDVGVAATSVVFGCTAAAATIVANLTAGNVSGAIDSFDQVLDHAKNLAIENIIRK